jgi:hypothetical protein
MFDHVVFGVTNYAQSKEVKTMVRLAFVIGPDGHNIEAVCHEPEASSLGPAA